MISFQRILGREEEFFSLLEASAQEACNAVTELTKGAEKQKAKASAVGSPDRGSAAG